MGTGEYGKSLYLLFNIIVYLKVLQEITCIFKQFFKKVCEHIFVTLGGKDSYGAGTNHWDVRR